jgi:hypothetical protein
MSLSGLVTWFVITRSPNAAERGAPPKPQPVPVASVASAAALPLPEPDSESGPAPALPNSTLSRQRPAAAPPLAGSHPKPRPNAPATTAIPEDMKPF